MLEVQSIPWVKILKFYKSLNENPGWDHAYGMVLLVEKILNSSYANYIYGATSMHNLLIAQTPAFAHDREVLVISAGSKTNEVVMEWKGSQWKRSFTPELVFAGFEKFMKLQKWFL